MAGLATEVSAEHSVDHVASQARADTAAATWLARSSGVRKMPAR